MLSRPRERPIGASSNPYNLAQLFPLLARVPSLQDSLQPLRFPSRVLGLSGTWPLLPLAPSLSLRDREPTLDLWTTLQTHSADLLPAVQLPCQKLVLPIGWNYTWWFVGEGYQKCFLRSATVGVAYDDCPITMRAEFQVL